MVTRGIRLAAATGLLTALTMLTGTATAADGGVGIARFTFAPGTVTIVAGESVTWTNRDGVGHTASGSGWDTGVLNRGESASVTFVAAGTFPYACEFHPNMRGTVEVRATGSGAVAGVTSGAGTGASSGAGTGATAPSTDTLGEGPTSAWAAPFLLALAGVVGLALGARRRERAARRAEARAERNRQRAVRGYPKR